MLPSVSHTTDRASPLWERAAYCDILTAAHKVSCRVRQRVQELIERYPDSWRDDLARFGEQPDDLRLSLRKATQHPLHVWVPSLLDVALDTIMLDRSEGGIALRSPVPLAPGTLVYVRAAAATEDATWIPLEARHCEPVAGAWKVGCQFMNENLRLDDG